MVSFQQYDAQRGGKPLSDILWNPKLYILNSKSKKPYETQVERYFSCMQILHNFGLRVLYQRLTRKEDYAKSELYFSLLN